MFACGNNNSLSAYLASSSTLVSPTHAHVKCSENEILLGKILEYLDDFTVLIVMKGSFGSI